MLRFKDFLAESKSSIAEINSLVKNGELVFILYGGTWGSGKSYHASNNFKGFQILDSDEISKELTNGDLTKLRVVSKEAGKEKNSRRDSFFKKKISFIEMGASSSLSGTQKKFELAKSLGYKTVFIYVDVKPEKAIQRNRERIASGDRGVDTEREHLIQKVYDDSLSVFKALKNKVDYYIQVTS